MSRLPLPVFALIGPGELPVCTLALLVFALALLAAWAGPVALLGFLGLILLGGLSLLAWRHLEIASAAWLLLAGCTLEMTLSDLFGLGWYQPVIAAVKGMELVLIGFAILRYGLARDWANPALVFVAMFAAGLAHGLYPGLGMGESLRSLVGSAAPYGFSFARLSPRWADAIIAMTRRIPLLSVAAGAVLDRAGIRPIFMQADGVRLAALGHPAFLAGFCLAALYACLIELYRHGRRRDLALLIANALILVLTGARAPLAYGGAVVVLSLAFVSAPAMKRSWRWALLLGGAALLPGLILLGGDLEQLRLFNVLSNAAVDLSGRQDLWPAFERAAAASPWFGWGVGAGNAVIPPDSALAHEIGTWAAHNEYLRMAVEGGQLGRAALILSFFFWVRGHTRSLATPERRIMRLVFLAFAAHAATDNILISTSACVLFAFASAVFARGAAEAAARDGRRLRPSRAAPAGASRAGSRD
ncbi:MAG: O-antigen ligase family protein [Rhodospirillales bacterium]|nr:O-antigen ligase family protein [Rhodospirillales bacterium]